MVVFERPTRPSLVRFLIIRFQSSRVNPASTEVREVQTWTRLYPNRQTLLVRILKKKTHEIWLRDTV